MKTSTLVKLLKENGFSSLEAFKKYMKSHAKDSEYGGCKCYTETRNGLELNFSDNCKNVFGIGGNIRGSFLDYRFN